VTPRRFAIRYDPWCGWLLGLLGLGRRFSGVDVTPAEVVIRMGWAFRLRFPRSAIVTVEPYHDRVLGWGVHGWRRSWLVNGSSHGIVRLRLDPACRGRVVLVPWTVDDVLVSVDDPDGLMTALG
jgi:hypothetical protein